jgi:hypothetical protein
MHLSTNEEEVTKTLTKPATQKQLDFIYSLLKDIDSDNAGEAMLAFTDGDPTTKSASAFIDRLRTEITGVVHAPPCRG